MFSIYWLKQRQKEIEMLDHPHCMFSDYFFRQEQAREIFFHMTSSLCLVENQRNGTAKKPMQSFLCDRHQNHRRVKSVSFSIIWHRHWERIGKILSSECKQVLKVRGESKASPVCSFLFHYTRQVLDGFVNCLLKWILILEEVFIPQYKC